MAGPCSPMSRSPMRSRSGNPSPTWRTLFEIVPQDANVRLDVSAGLPHPKWLDGSRASVAAKAGNRNITRPPPLQTLTRGDCSSAAARTGRETLIHRRAPKDLGRRVLPPIAAIRACPSPTRKLRRPPFSWMPASALSIAEEDLPIPQLRDSCQIDAQRTCKGLFGAEVTALPPGQGPASAWRPGRAEARPIENHPRRVKRKAFSSAFSISRLNAVPFSTRQEPGGP